jgi:hypothetical protein
MSLDRVNMNTNIKKTLTWVTLFAIAMGYMESSIVVYLRELFYKTGFEFPLKHIPANIARIEFFRELATMIMLIACGILAGSTKLHRFAYFLYAFAIWDLCYYLFLYVCLGWPSSLSTWDILFLIPVPWVGPVWAPCLLSVLMIIGAVVVIRKIHYDHKFKVSTSQWWFVITGAFTCIVSFMWDYLAYNSNDTWTIFSSDQLFAEISGYVPTQFNYPLFLTGFAFMSFPLIQLINKSNKS